MKNVDLSLCRPSGILTPRDPRKSLEQGRYNLARRGSGHGIPKQNKCM